MEFADFFPAGVMGAVIDKKEAALFGESNLARKRLHFSFELLALKGMQASSL
jgi:hypothetical protein